MGQKRHLTPRKFVAAEPLVASRFIQYNGKDIQRGELIPPDEELGLGARMRLWLAGRAIYQKDFRPTEEAPLETVEQVQVTTLEVSMVHTGGAWYLIQAPWQAEPEKIQGKAAAEARVKQLTDEGAPAWYTDQPDWSDFGDEPEAWTDEQRGVFQAWFETVPKGGKVQLESTGVARAFAAARDGTPEPETQPETPAQPETQPETPAQPEE